jgi:hypothetical protein
VARPRAAPHARETAEELQPLPHPGAMPSPTHRSAALPSASPSASPRPQAPAPVVARDPARTVLSPEASVGLGELDMRWSTDVTHFQTIRILLSECVRLRVLHLPIGCALTAAQRAELDARRIDVREHSDAPPLPEGSELDFRERPFELL